MTQEESVNEKLKRPETLQLAQTRLCLRALQSCAVRLYFNLCLCLLLTPRLQATAIMNSLLARTPVSLCALHRPRSSPVVAVVQHAERQQHSSSSGEWLQGSTPLHVCRRHRDPRAYAGATNQSEPAPAQQPQQEVGDRGCRSPHAARNRLTLTTAAFLPLLCCAV